MRERRAHVPKVFEAEFRPMPAPVTGQPLDQLTIGLVLAPVVLAIVAICASIVVKALAGIA